MNQQQPDILKAMKLHDQASTVERIGEDLENVTHLLNVCVDSLTLHEDCGLDSTCQVMEQAVEKAWKACQQAKALQEELYEAWRNANNGRDAA